MKYVCPRYPAYKIKHLEFLNGMIEVDSRGDIGLIEANDWFGVYVFKVNEQAPQPEGEEDEESTPHIGDARHQLRRSRGRPRLEAREEGNEAEGPGDR